MTREAKEIAVALQQIEELLIPAQLARLTWKDRMQKPGTSYGESVGREKCAS